jgi:hypothetical protein
MTGAYEFVCSMASTDELLARLRELGTWEWRMGDSYWYGDYLACVPFTGVRIRICDYPDPVGNQWKYRVDVRRSAECKTPMPMIDAALGKLLARIPAHSIGEIEWFD